MIHEIKSIVYRILEKRKYISENFVKIIIINSKTNHKNVKEETEILKNRNYATEYN